MSVEFSHEDYQKNLNSRALPCELFTYESDFRSLFQHIAPHKNAFFENFSC